MSSLDPEEQGDDFYSTGDEDDEQAEIEDQSAGTDEGSASEIETEDEGDETCGICDDDDSSDDSWERPHLVYGYAYRPPKQKDRDESKRKGEEPPKMYATRDFYQVKPISEILFKVGIMPYEAWDYDPTEFVQCRNCWGM